MISLGGALAPGTRTLVEDALGVEVFERYSALEIGIVGSECERHRMHVNVGSLHIEGAFREGSPASADSQGTDVIVTDLFNYGMPLLRYDLGDRIELASGDCPCGRRSPLIRRIRGHVVDQITTQGGEWVDPFRIGNLLRDMPSLKQYQFVQPTVDRYELVGKGPTVPAFVGGCLVSLSL